MSSEWLKSPGANTAVICGNNNEYINESVIKTIQNIGFVWEESSPKVKELILKFYFEKIFRPTDNFQKLKFFVTGSDAVEAALLVAKQVTKKKVILSHSYAFHGWTHNACTCSDFPEFSRFVDEDGHYKRMSKTDTYYFEYPICTECPYDKCYGNCDSNGELHCISMLRKKIEEIGPQNIAAVFSDCILGLAAVVPPKEYISQFYSVIKEYGLLWIDDEIYSAFRLGRWFAYQEYDNIAPDILCFGKSLSNGITPISGIALSKDVSKKLDNYKWQMCSSYAGNPISLTAAYANLRFIEKNNLLDKVACKEKIFFELFSELKKKHPLIKGIHGKGMFWCIELNDIVNQKNRRFITAKGNTSTLSELRKICLENGLLIGGYVNNFIRISPAITMTEQEIEKACEIFDRSLLSCYNNLKK